MLVFRRGSGLSRRKAVCSYVPRVESSLSFDNSIGPSVSQTRLFLAIGLPLVDDCYDLTLVVHPSLCVGTLKLLFGPHTSVRRPRGGASVRRLSLIGCTSTYSINVSRRSSLHVSVKTGHLLVFTRTSCSISLVAIVGRCKISTRRKSCISSVSSMSLSSWGFPSISELAASSSIMRLYHMPQIAFELLTRSFQLRCSKLVRVELPTGSLQGCITNHWTSSFVRFPATAFSEWQPGHEEDWA